MKGSLPFKVTFVIVYAILFAVYLNGCSKTTEHREAKERKEEQKRDRDLKESQKNLNEFLYRKEATLLSIKYRIDEDKIFNLIVETQEPNSENIQNLLEGKSITRNRLISLSEKYNIAIDVVANILIDYYSMQPSGND